MEKGGKILIIKKFVDQVHNWSIFYRVYLAVKCIFMVCYVDREKKGFQLPWTEGWLQVYPGNKDAILFTF